MMSKKKAILSFGNERGNYLIALERLKNSLSPYLQETMFLGYVGENSLGCPKHMDNPYAFKIYGIDYAISQGYEKILWLDSSVVAKRSLDRVWKKIDEQGYIMQEAGHYVGRWCNDSTLNYFGLTREEANGMLMYGNAGFLGLDFTQPIAQEFFRQWKESMLAGCFVGSWDDHRHDMTCGSIIANRLKMKYESGIDLLAYAPVDIEPINENIIFHASGL